MPCTAKTSTDQQAAPERRTDHGRVLRDRLGRRPPRHRPGQPGRAAAGPPPDQRRRGRARGAAGPARRARRHPRRPDPGSDRDAPRAAGRVPARHRPTGLPGQPDGGGPLPGPALRRQGRNPTTATRSSWPACCAPTRTCTGRCPPTPSWPRPSRCWPAPSKTPSGTAPRPATGSAPTCASTTPASWPPSAPPAAASCAPRPAPSWPPPPPPPTPPASPRPSSAPP